MLSKTNKGKVEDKISLEYVEGEVIEGYIHLKMGHMRLKKDGKNTGDGANNSATRFLLLSESQASGIWLCCYPIHG